MITGSLLSVSKTLTLNVDCTKKTHKVTCKVALHGIFGNTSGSYSDDCEKFCYSAVAA